ncbi:MAG TPA: hypothetical protein DF296_08350 [Candidatus Margulisbacteria bacterium]|nr:MAG: hypothetical protein A2X41_11110 [Candidatus Margulisbacteria bacterium GWE2_39_32]HCT85196.1 hypothetical protein [Candidatus Margulisiibacteriota bacterium]
MKKKIIHLNKLNQIRVLGEQSYAKDFYVFVDKHYRDLDSKTLENLIKLEPFIYDFNRKFTSFLDINKKAPLETNSKFYNRLEEIYAGIIDHADNFESLVFWLLEQRVERPGQLIFPFKPYNDDYDRISRGLEVLTSLIKTIELESKEVYERLLEHVRTILMPTINEELNQLAKRLADELLVVLDKNNPVPMKELKEKIAGLNKMLKDEFIGTNNFLLINQYVKTINERYKLDLPLLEKGKQPEFIRIHAFECITKLQLRNEKAIKLALQFMNGFESEIVRKEAANVLQRSMKEVKQYFYKCIKLEPDYKQKLIISAKHDEIFGNVNAEELVNILGSDYNEALHELNSILNNNTINLSGFLRSAYLKMSTKPLNKKDFPSKYSAELFKKLEEKGYVELVGNKKDKIIVTEKVGLEYSSFGNELEEIFNQIITLKTNNSHILQDSAVIYWETPKMSDIKDIKERLFEHYEIQRIQQIKHFSKVNASINNFKDFIEGISPGTFENLFQKWGIEAIVAWAVSDYEKEERLFQLIVQTAIDNVQSIGKSSQVSMNDIISILLQEPDAKNLIGKFMELLLNSKISFSYEIFRSLLQVVAQRELQLRGGAKIVDGFQLKMVSFTDENVFEHNESKVQGKFPLNDPDLFRPIYVFLITALNLKLIEIPPSAFVETDISFFINSLALHKKRDLGYKMYLAHKLIESIPHSIVWNKHENFIRKTIADLDGDFSEENTLIHYLRIKIHRYPSKVDLPYCLTILEGLSSQNTEQLLEELKQLMKGVGEKAIPDLENFFNQNSNKLKEWGAALNLFKDYYPNVAWQDIAEQPDLKEKIKLAAGNNGVAHKVIEALVNLANGLANHWTYRANEDFIKSQFNNENWIVWQQSDLRTQLRMVRERRESIATNLFRYDENLSPYEYIFLKRHVAMTDWEFQVFGFWPVYKERKFELYNNDRQLALLERKLLEESVAKITAKNDIESFGVFIKEPEINLLPLLRENMKCLADIMVHASDEGLAPSQVFIDAIDILKKDQLTVSQLRDIVRMLSNRELYNIDSFLAGTFADLPSKVAKILGKDNLDYGVNDLKTIDNSLFYHHIQEKMIGDFRATAHPLPLLEMQINNMQELLNEIILSARGNNLSIESMAIFPEGVRPGREDSPISRGTKANNLFHSLENGLNVPPFINLSTNFFASRRELLDPQNHNLLKNELIEHLLKLEEKTSQLFPFKKEKLTEEQWNLIQDRRSSFKFDISKARELVISVRSGSYFSMPGILGTIINVGFDDIAMLNKSGNTPEQVHFTLDSYRMFLTTFGNVVFNIDETEFSKKIDEFKQQCSQGLKRSAKWKDLTNEDLMRLINEFKVIIEKANQKTERKNELILDWDDPLSLVAHGVRGVRESWDTAPAIRLREQTNVSGDWGTPVTLQVMKFGNLNAESFSAIFVAEADKTVGDVLFGRAGEDIASGLASKGIPFEYLEKISPTLFYQIKDMIKNVKENLGGMGVDIEIVGEYDPNKKQYDVFLLQDRQLGGGKKGESEDFEINPSPNDKPVTKGKGIVGGAQHNVCVDGTVPYDELLKTVQHVRETLDTDSNYIGKNIKIHLLMEYVTPEEALKINIPGVDGIWTSKIGTSSHASISARRKGIMFLSEVQMKKENSSWTIGNGHINLATVNNFDVFTTVGNSPIYGGNIFKGEIPLKNRKKQEVDEEN